MEFNHKLDWNNVKILNIKSRYHERLISEMLRIKKQANGLNLRKDTELLDESYNIIDKLRKVNIRFHLFVVLNSSRSKTVTFRSHISKR